MVKTKYVEDEDPEVRLEVLVEGDGEPVVLLPSAMRGAVDFGAIQRSLAEAGYRSFAVNPRGAGGSTPPRPDISLRDLADDVALVVEVLGGGYAHIVGHALGNIVVRATAAYRPEVTATVSVMPCGGHSLDAHPVSDEVLAAFPRCHDETLSEDERLDALRLAFFARGNDPHSWLDGWWPTSTFGSLTAQQPDEWWQAGSAPILIIQPLEDAMAPAEVGREVAVALGERATYVEIPNCGHAILPERPDAVTAHLVAFFRAHPLSTRPPRP
jgi:pimeloyl-ACP methyl ester carboxylesterase